MTDAQPDGSFDDDTVAEEFLTLGRRRRRRRRPPRWPRAAARLPQRYLLVLAATGWVAAAVLCAIAPYRAIVTLHRPGAPGRRAQTVTMVDGWGDTPGGGGSAEFPATNFGILLWSGAALLLVLAGLMIARVWGKAGEDFERRWLDLCVVGATALVVGVVAAVITSTVGFKSWIDERIAATPVGLNLNLDARWGGCPWLALAGLLCAVGATAGFLQDRARTQSGPRVTSADEVFVIGALREGAE